MGLQQQFFLCSTSSVVVPGGHQTPKSCTLTNRTKSNDGSNSISASITSISRSPFPALTCVCVCVCAAVGYMRKKPPDLFRSWSLGGPFLPLPASIQSTGNNFRKPELHATVDPQDRRESLASLKIGWKTGGGPRLTWFL